jgi:hypothetical protein
VHALRNVHATLAPGAILVDTQPVSARPPVASDGVSLGSLDMRAWLDTIQAVDGLVAETIRIGLYELQHESRFVVTDTFDDGPERNRARQPQLKDDPCRGDQSSMGRALPSGAGWSGAREHLERSHR